MNFLLNDKIETALQTIITAALDDVAVTVLTGKSASDQVLPCIVCTADGDGMEDPIGSGNFWVNAAVLLKTSASDTVGALAPRDYQQSLEIAVHGALMVSDLATELNNAVTDLTVFDGSIQFGAAQSGEDENGVWIMTQPIRLYCCASQV